jgi:hypothetical protein
VATIAVFSLILIAGLIWLATKQNFGGRELSLVPLTPTLTPTPTATPQQPNYVDGTLVKGSSEKVYVILNGYRHCIPDEATFNARGYNWSKINWLTDNLVNAIPEGAPLRSVSNGSPPQTDATLTPTPAVMWWKPKEFTVTRSEVIKLSPTPTPTP